MRKEIVDRGWIRSIPSGEPLELESFSTGGDHVIEGVLRQPDGHWYPIVKGVPSFLLGQLRPDLGLFITKYGLNPVAGEFAIPPKASEQAQTNKTFSDKWLRFKNYGFETEHRDFLFKWYCKKLGFSHVDELKAFYRSKSMVLEVGPGSGFNTRFIAENCAGTVFACDIADAAFTTYDNTSDLPNCHVVQADLMATPFPDEFFDFIIADGVLHHTPDTRASFEALFRKVKPGGQFFFYVYRKMGPARQFCDEYIRRSYTSLEPEACYALCEGLTELGRELSNLKARIRLEKGIPVLGIPPGEHDVQRLLYYNFLKCFWNDAFDFETNNMVNFDWYHPHNAWKHTDEEVIGWLKNLGVTDFRVNPANPNGISVLATKPAH